MFLENNKVFTARQVITADLFFYTFTFISQL